MSLEFRGQASAKEVNSSVVNIQSLTEVSLECVWQGNNMGVVICSFHLNISPKMSYGVLESDIVMLQNYMLMIL